MEFLIFFYDNSLIYYPNVFFAVLSFIVILGTILVSIEIIVLGKRIRRVIEEIKSNLNQIRRIKINEKRKIPFIQMIKVFFQRKSISLQRKSISLVYIIRALTIFLVHMIMVTFIRINTALGYIESQTERIVKRIGKEVLIEE